MSGDVQPRKRKDKKKKKDELSIEETRGTAAIFGDGDVFIHSQHDHGTGGHWCAKIIFFSLLAVLVTLIGLIILENRGLTELEANSVESRYSGVLEGWIEDIPDDDHHDAHTLELKHQDDEEQHAETDHINDEDEDIDDREDSEEEIDDHEDGGDDEDDDDDEGDDEDGNDDEDGDDDEDDDDDSKNDQDISQEAGENDDQEENEPSNNVRFGLNHESNEYIEDIENNESEEIDEYNDHNKRFSKNLDDEIDNLTHEDKSNEDDKKHGNYTNQDSNEAEEDIENHDDSDDNDEDDDDDDVDDNDVENFDEYTEHNQYENGEKRAYNYYNSNPSLSSYKESASNKRFKREFDYDDNFDSKIKESKRDSTEKNDINTEIYDSEEIEEHEEDVEEHEDVQVEHIEKEITDEDILSVEQEEKPQSQEEDASNAEDSNEIDKEDEDFLDPVDDDKDNDDADEPPLERITVPAGKPYVEIEEDVTEKPSDTLADEEEYEKQQEELRKEEAEASHIWLKLVVGGALLVATHAVLRRATAPRDENESEEVSNEETNTQGDRRMTLISEEPLVRTVQENIRAPATPPNIPKEDIVPIVTKSVQAAYLKPDDKNKLVKEPEQKKEALETRDDEDKELYSDQEEIEEEEEENGNQINTNMRLPENVENKEDDEPEDDVEIIDEEQIEEELEEDVEEEEISDIDDSELLTRLEAKYGRLPEPERPGKHKDGGNSIDDAWPGEPSDSHWRHELNLAEDEFRQGAWTACERRASAEQLADSARARWLVATALDNAAEEKRDNRLLSRAITAYLHLLKMNEHIPDKKLQENALRTINRMQFLGRYLNTEPVYRLLIRRFPNEVGYRNSLTISFLMANRADLADGVLKETLQLWPNDRVALAHYGFVLKNHHKKLEESVKYLQKALDGDAGAANEPRFFYQLGDALLLLGRLDEAHEVHKRGAALGHFLSPVQRSLYNVPRLKSRPWWRIEDTVYAKLARALEKSWRDILKEGEAARELFEKENEGLKERGEWSQLDIFVQGRELPGRCQRAPVTCALIRSEPAASGCRRGQAKFSSMAAGTHVRPHVGPTNCRLRIHLALSNTKDTFIRVDKEIRQWQVGKVFMFDDSFEHEVWHNGTGSRLVLIVDVWHPDLTAAERRQLPAI